MAIETERYKRPVPPEDQRFCKHCENVTETEIHFILKCTCFTDIRERFIKVFENQNNLTEEELINSILNPKNSEDTKRLCVALNEMFTKRKIAFNKS